MRELLVVKRLERKLSQNYVSKLLGITQPAFCQLEQGRRNITVEEALKIKAIYDMDWEEFQYVFQEKNQF